MNLRVSFCHHIVILMSGNSIICWECFWSSKALSAAFEEVYEIPYWNQAQAITSAESSSGETR